MSATSAGEPSKVAAENSRLVRWWNISIAFMVFAVVAYIFAGTAADPDLWGHLRFGQDIRKAREVVTADPYSYLTSGQVWINHEWLAEVVFSWVFDVAGSAGLVLLKLAIGLLAVLCTYLYLRRRGVRIYIAAVVSLLLAIPLLPTLRTVRPQLFTLLFFTLTMLSLSMAHHHSPLLLLAMPLYFVIWCNAHGGFIAGALIVLLWFVADSVVLLVRARRAKELLSSSHLLKLGATLAALLATLLNPYGLDLWRFLLRTATVPRPEITEWRPIGIISTLGATYVVLLVTSSAALIGSRRERPPALVMVYACIALLPLVAVRHLSLFAVAAAVICGEHIQDVWERRPRLRGQSPRAGPKPRLVRLLLGLSCVLGVALIGASFRALPCIQLEGGDYPVRAIALIKASVPQGNLAIHFNWGEYAIWHLGPQIKVSMDGRRETVYSEEMYRENLRFMTGVGQWDALLEEHDTDLALVKKADATYNLLRLKPEWIMLYEDPLSALFVPQDSPLRQRIEATPLPALVYDGEGLCFP